MVSYSEGGLKYIFLCSKNVQEFPVLVFWEQNDTVISGTPGPAAAAVVMRPQFKQAGREARRKGGQPNGGGYDVLLLPRLVLDSVRGPLAVVHLVNNIL